MSIPVQGVENDLENYVSIFKKRYNDFLQEKKDNPSSRDVLGFMEYERLEKVMECLSKRDEIEIRNGKIILKNYKNLAVAEKMGRRAPKDINEIFFDKYKKYCDENNGNKPGIYEFVDYSGIDYPTLQKFMKKVKGDGRIRIIRRGKKKEIDLTEGLQANSTPSAGSAKSLTAAAGGYSIDSFNNLLKNQYVRNYLPELLSNNGSSLEPEIAARIVGAVPYSSGETDEKILKNLEADSEVSSFFNQASGNSPKIKRKREASRNLSRVRHFLFELYDKGVVSYDVETDDDTGWRTYLWRINPSGSDRLKKLCISKIEEEKAKLESMKQESNQFNYFCIKDKTHPVIPFGSKSYMGSSKDDFKCEECGSDLGFEEGSRIADSISQDLEKLNIKISEIEQIKI